MDEYRRKTRSRLIDKRREDKGAEQSNNDINKKRDNRFREKYRADLKERIMEEVTSKVDRTIVKKALKQLDSEDEVLFDHVHGCVERDLVDFDNSLFRSIPSEDKAAKATEHSLLSLSHVPLNLIMEKDFEKNRSANPSAVESFHAAMKNKLMKSSSAESDHAIDKIPFKELYESVIKTNGDRNQGVIGKLAQNASSDTKINTTGLMSKYVPNGSQFNRRKSNYLMSSVGNLSGVKTPQTSSYAYIDDTNAVNGVDNSLYSSLVDSIFLLGPSKHDIYLLLAAEQTSKKPSNTEFKPFSDSNTSHSTPSPRERRSFPL